MQIMSRFVRGLERHGLFLIRFQLTRWHTNRAIHSTCSLFIAALASSTAIVTTMEPSAFGRSKFSLIARAPCFLCGNFGFVRTYEFHSLSDKKISFQFTMIKHDWHISESLGITAVLFCLLNTQFIRLSTMTRTFTNRLFFSSSHFLVYSAYNFQIAARHQISIMTYSKSLRF